MITEFDKKLIHAAKTERVRLRLLQNELSNEALSKVLGISKGSIDHILVVRKKANRLSKLKALELCRQIRSRKCMVALFRVDLGWGLVNQSDLLDSDLQDDGFIGLYGKTVTWPMIFEDAR